MAWKVTYPLITTDAVRYFADKADADKFAVERLHNINSRFQTIHTWRRIAVVELTGDEAEQYKARVRAAVAAAIDE